MKKTTFSIIGGIACGITLLLAGQLYAATTGTITTVEGSIGGGTGPALAAKLSPMVHLGYTLESGDGLSFAINSENSTIDAATGNRNEYGIASDYSGYYQRVSATGTGTFAAPTADDSQAFGSTGNNPYTKM